MEFNSMSMEDQFRIATQECQIQLPPPPHFEMWRDFFLALFQQVINNEEREKRNRRERVWDFCVIHSNHPSDHERANQFVRLLETTLGISGKSLGSVALADNTLGAASAMVQGSTKVFVLVSEHFDRAGVPKFVFQNALMQELERPDWSCKIIPMYLSEKNLRKPFLSSVIKGLILGDDTRTVELVSKAIRLEDQMEVRAVRDRDRLMFNSKLRRLRRERMQEIQDVISKLRSEYGDDYDPTQELQQMIDVSNSMTLDLRESKGAEQVIKMTGCQQVSIGPSFHFHGSQGLPPPPPLNNNNNNSSSSSYMD